MLVTVGGEHPAHPVHPSTCAGGSYCSVLVSALSIGTEALLAVGQRYLTPLPLRQKRNVLKPA